MIDRVSADLLSCRMTFAKGPEKWVTIRRGKSRQVAELFTPKLTIICFRRMSCRQSSWRLFNL
jgi:hypothetical protein